MKEQKQLQKLNKKIQLAEEIVKDKDENDPFVKEIENLKEAAAELGEKLAALTRDAEWKKEAKKGKKRGRGYTKPLIKKGRGSRARKKR